MNFIPKEDKLESQHMSFLLYFSVYRVMWLTIISISLLGHDRDSIKTKNGRAILHLTIALLINYH